MNFLPKILLVFNLFLSISCGLNQDFTTKFIANTKRNADKVAATSNKISNLRLILLSDLKQNEIVRFLNKMKKFMVKRSFYCQQKSHITLKFSQKSFCDFSRTLEALVGFFVINSKRVWKSCEEKVGNFEKRKSQAKKFDAKRRMNRRKRKKKYSIR
jgi:hypothetical protein